MKAYLSIIKLRFILLLQYRAAAIAGICTQFLFGFVRIMYLEAFYSNSSSVQPMSFSQAVAYVWLGQALLGMFPWNGDGEVQGLIRNGNVAYELTRPLNLYNQWYARALAIRTAPTLLKSIPLFTVSMLFLTNDYTLQLPVSIYSGLAWLLSLAGALLLSCAITNIMNIATLWTVSGEGIVRLLPAVMIFFSGMSVPIPLFPYWLQTICRILPFSDLVDIPSRFYVGHIPPQSILPHLAHQLIWTLLLVLLGKFMLSKATKKIVVQGG